MSCVHTQPNCRSNKKAGPRPAVPPIRTSTDADNRPPHRWSDLVPPQTALTFVAIYDPSEGLIAFSASSLFPLDATTGTQAQAHANDGQEEEPISTCPATDRSALSTAALTSDTAMHDMQLLFGAYLRGEPQHTNRNTVVQLNTPRVSSTLGGLCIVDPNQRAITRTFFEIADDAIETDPEGSMRNHPETRNRYKTRNASICSSLGQRTVPARSRLCVDSFFVYDDCPFDPFHEQSAFSVSTTSTSSYVDVQQWNPPSCRSCSPDSDDGSSLSEPTADHIFDHLPYLQSPTSSAKSSSPKRRRWNNFTKKHSADLCADDDLPALNRRVEDNKSPHTSLVERTELPRLVRVISKRFLKHKRATGEDRWVYVNIEHKVTQHELFIDM